MTQMQNGPVMDKRAVFPELLWAGTEQSLLVAMDAHERMLAGAFTTNASGSGKSEDQPYLLKIQGDVGVIDIKGPLVNRDSWMNKYFGITSYADISRALVYAAEESSIKGILLDIDSGGGAVNGVADAGNLISTVNKLKPVWAFSGGGMASAAYWLGASARKVYSSNTSLLGSIGVITTHMEYSKALKEAGVGVTVMRAGKYKALANPMEPLSEKALEQIQAQLDAAYQVFIEHVAQARGVTVQVADQKMGQGREFFGDAALAAGLTDGIDSFDKVFGKFAAKVLDTKPVTVFQSGQQKQGSSMSRSALSPEVLAAAAQAGVTLDEGTAAPAAAPAGAPAAETPAAAPAAEAPAAAPAADKPGELVAFLRTQLDASQGQLVDLKVQIGQKDAELTALKGAQAGLVAIVANSLSTMRVAMKLGAVDATKLDAAGLVAEHKATTEQFIKSFPVGGVAASGAAAAPAPASVDDPHHMARIAATSLNSK
jgi:signal peptide peptidase SppA